MNRPWHVYVVKCADGTLYTGVGVDVALRVHAHNHRESGAEYTKRRRPVVLVASALAGDQGDALRAERAVKRLRRALKVGLVADPVAFAVFVDAHCKRKKTPTPSPG